MGRISSPIYATQPGDIFIAHINNWALETDKGNVTAETPTSNRWPRATSWWST